MRFFVALLVLLATAAAPAAAADVPVVDHGPAAFGATSAAREAELDRMLARAAPQLTTEMFSFGRNVSFSLILQTGGLPAGHFARASRPIAAARSPLRADADAAARSAAMFPPPPLPRRSVAGDARADAHAATLPPAHASKLLAAVSLPASPILSDGIERTIAETLVRDLSKVPERLRPSCLFLDVGANSGFFSQLGATLGFETHSFDPQPMCASARLNRVPLHLHNAAVGGPPEGAPPGADMEVHLSVCHGGYSWPDRWADRGAAVRVPLLSLGSFIGRRIVAAMKIDVEANEPSVLASCLPALLNGQIRRAVIEVKSSDWASKPGQSHTGALALFQALFNASVSAVQLEAPGTVLSTLEAFTAAVLRPGNMYLRFPRQRKAEPVGMDAHAR